MRIVDFGLQELDAVRNPKSQIRNPNMTGRLIFVIQFFEHQEFF